jgi:hypothetical protein
LKTSNHEEILPPDRPEKDEKVQDHSRIDPDFAFESNLRRLCGTAFTSITNVVRGHQGAPPVFLGVNEILKWNYVIFLGFENTKQILQFPKILKFD